MRNLTLIIILIALFGCAATNTNLTPELQYEVDTPLICTGKEECKVMWEKATYYVTRNSGYKIQIHNDSVIETYYPNEGDTKLAWQITKEPLGNDQYRIWVGAFCGNMFGCIVHPTKAMAEAKKYIRN